GCGGARAAAPEHQAAEVLAFAELDPALAELLEPDQEPWLERGGQHLREVRGGGLGCEDRSEGGRLDRSETRIDGARVADAERGCRCGPMVAAFAQAIGVDAKLTDVSHPWKPFEIGDELGRRQVALIAEEGLEERTEILRPFAERRDAQRRARELEVKALPE